MPKKAGSAIGQITVLAEKLAAEMGYDLIEAAYEKENTGMYLRFYLDKEEKTLRFDLVVSFDAKDRRQTYREVCETVQKEFPDYTLQVAMDTDFSEEDKA